MGTGRWLKEGERCGTKGEKACLISEVLVEGRAVDDAFECRPPRRRRDLVERPRSGLTTTLPSYTVCIVTSIVQMQYPSPPTRTISVPFYPFLPVSCPYALPLHPAV